VRLRSLGCCQPDEAVIFQPLKRGMFYRPPVNPTVPGPADSTVRGIRPASNMCNAWNHPSGAGVVSAAKAIAAAALVTNQISSTTEPRGAGLMMTSATEQNVPNAAKGIFHPPQRRLRLGEQTRLALAHNTNVLKRKSQADTLAPTTPPTSTSQRPAGRRIILQAALDANQTIVFWRSDAKLSKNSPLKSNWTAWLKASFGDTGADLIGRFGSSIVLVFVPAAIFSTPR